MYQTIEKRMKDIRIDLKAEMIRKMDHYFYYSKCGNVDPNTFGNFNFSDSDCEYSLVSYIWTEHPKYLNFVSDRQLDKLYSANCSLIEFQKVMKEINDTESFDHANSDEYSRKEFYGKGISEDEIKMFVCAIHSYTGGKSMINNRTLAYDIEDFFINSTQSKNLNSNFFLINSYMLKGLNYLPIYFGICTRSVNLTESEIQDYQPGSIVTWIQFSSSTIGNSQLKNFDNRTAVFIIYSVSGRCISHISQYAVEKEVVFLPFSQFLVVNIEYNGSKPHIYLRQIELGISEKNVLWVDQTIFNETSVVKSYIESAAISNPRIRFILKTSYESAIVYLKSEWGNRKKDYSGNFRIICNYFIPNNNKLPDSGIWLCSEAKQEGFNCKMMIYNNGNSEIIRDSLTAYGLTESTIKVADIYDDIFSFITFNRNS